MPEDDSLREKDEEEVLSPEELVAVASSAIYSTSTNTTSTTTSTEKRRHSSNELILKPAGGGDEEEGTAAAALLRRASSGAPHPPNLARNSQLHLPGAFRAGSSAFYEEDIDDEEREEEAHTETDLNNTSMIAAEHALLRLSSHSSATPVEATLVSDKEGTDVTEVIKAEPISEIRSNGSNSTKRRKKYCMCGLLVSVFVVLVAGIAVVVATVLLLEKNDKGTNETQVLIAPSSGSSDSWDEPKRTAAERLAPFDRITHHAAVFQWQTPKRCNLEPEATAWQDEPFVMLQCGQYGINSTLVLFEEGTLGAECTQRSENEIGCRAQPTRATDSFNTNYAALIHFSCGTHSKDYDDYNNSSGVIETAEIRVERTQAYCEAPTDSSVLDDDVRVVLSLQRICRTSLDVTSIRSSDKCRTNEEDDEDDFLYQVPEDRSICYRRSAPCSPSGVETFCDVDLHSFSAIDQIINKECRFESLEDREEVFQNGVAEILEAASDQPELQELVELILAP